MKELLTELEGIRDPAGDEGGIAFAGRIQKETWEALQNASLTPEKAEEILYSVGEGEIDTHQLAQALLALPAKKIRHENHTEMWSDPVCEDVQVGTHSI